MDAYALLQDWPGVGKANAESLLRHSAWCRLIDYAGERVAVRRTDEMSPDDLLFVSVRLDDEDSVLGFADTPLFSDLHRLWDRRNALPQEIVLALIEKECGSFFQVLEDLLKVRLSIKGVADSSAVDSAKMHPFRIATSGGDLLFSLNMSAQVAMTLGKVRYLDPAHESIRSLTREAWAEYAVVDLDPSAQASLKVGDCLVLPEDVRPNWRLSTPDDAMVHVRAAEAQSVSFGQVADENWPEIPEPTSLLLWADGRIVAKGTCVALGVQKAFRVEEVVNV